MIFKCIRTLIFFLVSLIVPVSIVHAPAYALTRPAAIDVVDAASLGEAIAFVREESALINATEQADVQQKLKEVRSLNTLVGLLTKLATFARQIKTSQNEKLANSFIATSTVVTGLYNHFVDIAGFSGPIRPPEAHRGRFTLLGSEDSYEKIMKEDYQRAIGLGVSKASSKKKIVNPAQGHVMKKKAAAVPRPGGIGGVRVSHGLHIVQDDNEPEVAEEDLGNKEEIRKLEEALGQLTEEQRRALEQQQEEFQRQFDEQQAAFQEQMQAAKEESVAKIEALEKQQQEEYERNARDLEAAQKKTDELNGQMTALQHELLQLQTAQRESQGLQQQQEQQATERISQLETQMGTLRQQQEDAQRIAREAQDGLAELKREHQQKIEAAVAEAQQRLKQQFDRQSEELERRLTNDFNQKLAQAQEAAKKAQYDLDAYKREQGQAAATSAEEKQSQERRIADLEQKAAAADGLIGQLQGSRNRQRKELSRLKKIIEDEIVRPKAAIRIQRNIRMLIAKQQVQKLKAQPLAGGGGGAKNATPLSSADIARRQQQMNRDAQLAYRRQQILTASAEPAPNPEIVAMHARVAALEDLVQQLNNERSKIINEQNRISSEQRRMEQNFADKQRSDAEKERQLQAFMSEQVEVVDELTGNVSLLQGDHAAMAARISELGEVVGQASQLSTDVRDELERVKASRVTDDAAIGKLTDDIQSRNGLHKDLLSQLDEMRALLPALQKQVADLTQQLNATKQLTQSVETPRPESPRTNVDIAGGVADVVAVTPADLLVRLQKQLSQSQQVTSGLDRMDDAVKDMGNSLDQIAQIRQRAEHTLDEDYRLRGLRSEQQEVYRAVIELCMRNVMLHGAPAGDIGWPSKSTMIWALRNVSDTYWRVLGVGDDLNKDDTVENRHRAGYLSLLVDVGSQNTPEAKERVKRLIQFIKEYVEPEIKKRTTVSADSSVDLALLRKATGKTDDVLMSKIPGKDKYVWEDEIEKIEKINYKERTAAQDKALACNREFKHLNQTLEIFKVDSVKEAQKMREDYSKAQGKGRVRHEAKEVVRYLQLTKPTKKEGRIERGRVYPTVNLGEKKIKYTLPLSQELAKTRVRKDVPVTFGDRVGRDALTPEARGRDYTPDHKVQKKVEKMMKEKKIK